MSDEPRKTVLFRMNGVAAGFLREYGCHSCPQCSSSKPQAHISASLLVKDTWQQDKRKVVYHALFDCGLGAIDSLIDFGAPPVNDVFVSHAHPYHALGLDRLVWGHFRHGGPLPLPIHCTTGTLDGGPRRVYPRFFSDKDPSKRDDRIPPKRKLFHVPVTPGKAEAISDAGIHLRVTPVSVYQGGTAGDAVIWVLEFGNTTTYRKLVLGWEFLHFVPPLTGEDPCRHCLEDSPPPDHERSAEGFDARFKGLFDNVDELFFDGNTRIPGMDVGEDTKHMSIQTGLRFLIPKVKPKRTWIVHYSGHEDPGGPMSDEELQHWLDHEKRKYGMNEAEIGVAKHGMVLAYEV